MVDNLQGNRIGVVAFAGAASHECPLTVDVITSRSTWTNLRAAQFIPIQGTSVGDAVKLAMESFPKGERRARAGTLILLTDGERLLPGKAVRSAGEAAKNACAFTPQAWEDLGRIPFSMKDERKPSVGPKTTKEGKVTSLRGSTREP